ncbi:MAG TPA: energy-coupling factor transporter transmembrane component T [Spirochaetia bacterium]|nr:energy-coupling factor transporter transmembrane component T [Spirochaetales bacterium]HOT58636.1 energy-coupling factor transporter transmembrane component T [Spirochaetales bacterium]HPD80925.1 energy-coupling factor transporter transmembrane component T [Spirochaetales bacterium]HQK34463.1 energy-coupling factor transporter transmembrane component T [Spirochaetales bacterium]HRS65304.1 energy-coupling factor transporter transmembrane component T [Spirochaetia bacterium]
MIHEDFFVYHHGETILYKINPLVKFLFMILFSCLVMTGNNLLVWICLGASGAMLLFSGIKIRYIMKGIVFVLLFVSGFKFIALVSIRLSPFAISIDAKELLESIVYVIRIMIVFIVNAFFYTTTTLADLRRTLRKYEKYIFVKVQAVYLPSTVLMLFLNFIPMSIATWHELEAAWVVRGGRNGLKKIFTLLPKLIERMLKKAIETAYALTVRAIE